MVGGNYNTRTRIYYPRRCKKEMPTNIDSLPDELMFEILLRLPVQHIYESARRVCKRWCHITNNPTFIYAHLHRMPTRLLLQTLAGYGCSLLVDLRDGRVEISELKHDFSYWARLSCNGLLIDYFLKSSSIHIVNPVTKQHFAVPHTEILQSLLYGIAYAPSSMAYKVVATWACRGDCCVIFTAGVGNSWRNVPCTHLSFEPMELFSSSPLVTLGFLHWRVRNLVLTLDIETEIIRETPAPIPQVDGYRWVYLSTERYLTLLLGIRDDVWEVWEMKPETGEWRKLSIISLEAHKRTFERFPLRLNEIMIPFGWLMYPEVLVFGFSWGNLPFIFPYNLITREIESIELPKPLKYYKFLSHKNSLVRV